MEHFLIKRSTWVLGLLGFLILGLIVTLTLVQTRQEIRQKALPATTARLSPNPLLITPNTAFDVNFDLDSGENTIATVAAGITFDPTHITATSVTVGNFFTSPVIVVPEHISSDSATITISGDLAGKKGSGTLVQIHFISGNGLGTTPVDIADMTNVTAIGETGNVLTSKAGTVITIATVFPTPSPSPSPSPTPTPTPSPSQSSTPSPTPSASPYVCTSPPANPYGLSATALGNGTIELNWYAVSGATYYGIVYGTDSGRYLFGAYDVGRTASFTVGNLKGDTIYYFSVFAVNDCGPSNYSNEAAAKTALSIGGTNIGPSPTPGTFASSSPTAENPFIPLHTDTDAIAFLQNYARPTPPVIPQVSIPPKYREKGETPAKNILLTPMGGGFLIVVAIFLGLFFWRMKHHS